MESIESIMWVRNKNVLISHKILLIYAKVTTKIFSKVGVHYFNGVEFGLRQNFLIAQKVSDLFEHR